MAKGTVFTTTAFGMCALFTSMAVAAASDLSIIELDEGTKITEVISSGPLDKVVVAGKEGIVGIKVFDKRCSKLKILTNKGVQDYTVCKDGRIAKEG